VRSTTFARIAVSAALAILAPVALVATAPVALAASGTGTGISYTLEGCRASTDAYLPGTFVCPTANYTTGNLGKGWNEFDLVPGRVTLDAGNSHPDSEQFAFVIAVDNCSTQDGATTCSGFPGYDRLSVPVLNAGLSSGDCGTIQVSGPQYAAPGIGGTGTTLYRTVTVSGQDAGATCVYDFYARLAFNSHLYPGASLHFNLANTSLGTAGIGARDVSIPVKEILPPGFTKSQTSTQGSDVVWSVRKSSSPATVNFPQTCPATVNPQSQAVTVTVTWTKQTTASGAVTVIASIQLQNNAHRSIDVTVSDQLYSGTTPAAGNEIQASKVTTITLAAGASDTITDTWSVTGSTATSFSDIATATFYDTVFQETLGTATRTASSSLVTLPPSSGATATVTDVERLTDASDVQLPATSPYRFSVDSVTGVAGSFSDYPTLGVQTVGPVTWSSGSVSSSGSTTFNKTVYVNSPTTDTAKLADTATVSPASQTATSANASSTITGGATVSIVINKRMNLAFTTAKTFTFTAKHTVNGTVVTDGSITITIPAGSQGPVSGTISGLEPGVTYTVFEDATAPFGPQQFVKTITLPNCSASQDVENTGAFPHARVRKITDPNPAPVGATEWTFTLTGGGLNEAVTATANAGYTTFPSTLVQDGATYTITETAKTNWDLTNVSGDVDGSAARVTTSTSSRTCSFTLNLTTDSLLSCTFTNTQRAQVRVIKTENGGVPTHAYTFQLTGGPDSVTVNRVTDGVNLGTLDFGFQKPGSYTLCELAVPAGTTSTLQTVYGGTLNATTGDICLTFALAAGVDRTFTIDNSFPGGGQRTIGYWKRWNTYTMGSGAAAKAAQTGNHLMDEFLPQSLGNYVVDTAAKGVAVLSAASGKYAENQLAAQLLAAKLNVAAGASTCASVTNAIAHADSLLVQIGYSGPPSSKVGPGSPLRSDFLSTAALLDNYNNGLVC
jgi:hypothetical protein